MQRPKEQRVGEDTSPTKETNQIIVLDLDSTVVHTFENMSELRKLNIYKGIRNAPLRSKIYTLNLFDVVTPPGTGDYNKMWGVIRPGWEKFREYIRKRFKSVVIWSAGQPKYVDAVVGRLFPDANFQPDIVYTWENCVKNRYEIYKPLTELVKDPMARGAITLLNTFVIDDRDDTFSKNSRNGIKIPVYEPESTSESILKEDERLEELMNFFSKEEVIKSEDVRKLDKTKIFS